MKAYLSKTEIDVHFSEDSMETFHNTFRKPETRMVFNFKRKHDITEIG